MVQPSSSTREVRRAEAGKASGGNEVTEPAAGSQDLEDGALEGLGVGPGTHGASHSVNVVPRNVTVVRDVLDL